MKLFTSNEKDIVLAEFMGFEKVLLRKNRPDECIVWKHPDMMGVFGEHGMSFMYHTWNGLMPICKEFDNLFNGRDRVPFEYVELCIQLDNTVTLYDESKTYDQLVLCIEWYNSLSRVPSTNFITHE